MRAAGLQGVHRRRTGRSKAATKALTARKERVFDDSVEGHEWSARYRAQPSHTAAATTSASSTSLPTATPR